MDDPPYLTVGTEVSAKYKGAFCEAKIRKVVRVVKCRVLFKSGLGSFLISDEGIKGVLRVGATVEAKHPDRGGAGSPYFEATISKIQDCSQYTVVFDDGDITTLRRSALCLKSGRHFNESETLDQLPLTHPEHFSNPVVGGSGRRGGASRRRAAANTEEKEESSEDEEEEEGRGSGGAGSSGGGGRGGGGGGSSGKRKGQPQFLHDFGTVVIVEISDNKTKKSRDSWFPALVVSPTAQETVKIRTKEECLVRSFKDGRYYTVPKKEINEFVKESHGKTDSCSTGLKTAVEKATLYLDKDELPPHWDRDALFGSPRRRGGGGDQDGDSDTDGDDEVLREKKDNFVAQLYKFMEERGTPINKGPTVCNKDLDLHKLYSVVVDQGGYSKVTNGGQWKNITGRLGFGAMPSTSTINLVKQAYKKYLLHFDELNKKLGYNIHTAAISKPRNSRSVYRSSGTPVPPAGSNNAAGSSSAAAAAAAAAAKKEKEKELKEVSDPSEEDKKGGDMDSDSTESSKKSTATTIADDEPRRSRSRQESSRSGRRNDKDSKEVVEDEVKEKTEPKKRGKSGKEKEPKEPVSSIKQTQQKSLPDPEEGPPPPNLPSQSSSSSSKKGGAVTQPPAQPSGVGSARKNKKEKDAAAAVAAAASTAASSSVKETPSSELEHSSPAGAPGGSEGSKKVSGIEHEIPGAIGKDVKIQIGDKLLVIYPKGDHNVTYDAKVLDANEKMGTFFVHYLGWNNRYDEWISRVRIAENLSLRENYQSKSQGKGPGPLGPSTTSTPTPAPPGQPSSTHPEEDKPSKGKKQQRGRSLTPAPRPPTPAAGSPSTTGTRSKTSANASSSVPSPTPSITSGKRKRLSTSERSSDPSETSSTTTPTPGGGGKKKRSQKKGEAKSELMTDSESEIEGSGKSAPTILRTPTPTRASSANKTRERKLQQEKDAKASAAEGGKKDQLLDLAAIRSEMKGVDKMVKGSKTTTGGGSSSAASGPKASVSPPSLIPGPGGESKTDIYEFDDFGEPESAPKLKMFSPRSPDKKEEKDDKEIKEKETKEKDGKMVVKPATSSLPTTPPQPLKGKNTTTTTPPTIAMTNVPQQQINIPPTQPQPTLVTSHPPPPPLTFGGKGAQGPRASGSTPSSITSTPTSGRGRGGPGTAATIPPTPIPQTLPQGQSQSQHHSPLIIPRPVVAVGGGGPLPSPYVSMVRAPGPGPIPASSTVIRPPGGGGPPSMTPLVVLSGGPPLLAGVGGGIAQKGTPTPGGGGQPPSGLSPQPPPQTYFPKKQEIFPHLVQQQQQSPQIGGPSTQQTVGKPHLKQQLQHGHGTVASPNLEGEPKKKPRSSSKPRPQSSVIMPPSMSTSSEVASSPSGVEAKRGKDKSVKKPSTRSPTPKSARGGKGQSPGPGPHPTPTSSGSGDAKAKKRRGGESPPKQSKTQQQQQTPSASLSHSHPPPPKISKTMEHTKPQLQLPPFVLGGVRDRPPSHPPSSNIHLLPSSQAAISKINETISSLMHQQPHPSSGGSSSTSVPGGGDKPGGSSHNITTIPSGPVPTAASRKLMEPHHKLEGSASAGSGPKAGSHVELTVPSPAPHIGHHHGQSVISKLGAVGGGAGQKTGATSTHPILPKQDYHHRSTPQHHPPPALVAAVIPSKIMAGVGGGNASQSYPPSTLSSSTGFEKSGGGGSTTATKGIDLIKVKGQEVGDSGSSTSTKLHSRERRESFTDDKKSGVIQSLESRGDSGAKPNANVNVKVLDQLKKDASDFSTTGNDSSRPRPLTPSFLHSQETLEPDEEEEDGPSSSSGGVAYTLSAKAVLLPTTGSSSRSKELDVTEESCSSLLCEEEIPGSPAASGGGGERLKFDFSRGGIPEGDKDDGELDEDVDEEDEDDEEEEDEEEEELMNEKTDKKKPVNRPTLLPKKGGVGVGGGSGSGSKPPRSRRNESLVLGMGTGPDSPPSTPDSPASFSTETGSPHVDSGRISGQGEEMEEDGGSKSKDEEDSSDDGDGESGDGDMGKSYYSGSPRLAGRNKSGVKGGVGGPRPKILTSLSRSRPQLPIPHQGPGGKKRKLIRKRSPTDDYAKQFGYRGIRSASGRKIQSSIDVHEAIRGPPPPPVNLAKRPHSEKYNHLYAQLEGVEDPEERIALVVKSMQDIREEYLKVKARIQTRERKERRRKRKLREKAAAERQGRLEAAKTLASQSQPQTGQSQPLAGTGAV